MKKLFVRSHSILEINIVNLSNYCKESSIKYINTSK